MSALKLTIGKRIKEARLARRMSEQELIDATKIPSIEVLRQFESGDNIPDEISLSKITTLAEVLSVSESYFFCEDDDTANVILHMPTLKKHQYGVYIAIITHFRELVGK